MYTTLPATKNFRIIVNLSHFFHDHRTKARIFINENIKQVSDLEDRIKGIFHIKKFHLTVQNEYLPPSESVGILQHDDVVWVMPKYFEQAGAASASSRTGEREQKIKKKRSNSDVTMADMSPEKESQKQKKKEKLYTTTDCEIEASIKKIKCKPKFIEGNSNSRIAAKTTTKKGTDGSETGKAVATDDLDNGSTFLHKKSSPLPITINENSKQLRIELTEMKHIHNTRESLKTCNKKDKESLQKLTKKQRKIPQYSSSSDGPISPMLAKLRKWYFVPVFNNQCYRKFEILHFLYKHPNRKIIVHENEVEEIHSMDTSEVEDWHEARETKKLANLPIWRDVPIHSELCYSMQEVLECLANTPDITVIEKVKEVDTSKAKKFRRRKMACVSSVGEAVATDDLDNGSTGLHKESSPLPTTMDENSKRLKINNIDMKHIHNTRESVKTCNKNDKESLQKLTKDQQTPPNSSTSDDTISPPAVQVEEESCLQPNQNKVCHQSQLEKVTKLRKWYFLPAFDQSLYTVDELLDYIENHPNIELIEHVQVELDPEKYKSLIENRETRYSMTSLIECLAANPNVAVIERVNEVKEHSMDTSEAETAPNANLELKDLEEELHDPSNLELACEKSMDVTQDSTSIPRRCEMACVSSVGQLLTDLRSVTPASVDNTQGDCNESVTKRQRKRVRRRKNKKGKSSTDTVAPSSVANGSAVPRGPKAIACHKHYIFEEGKDGEIVTIDITPYGREPCYPGSKAPYKYDSDILRAPMMKPDRSPEAGNIIAFKMLRITENCTPGVSEQIIGKVKEFDEESDEVVYEILRGLDQCDNPDDTLSEDKEAQGNQRVLMWKDMIDARLLYPQLNIT